MLADLASVVLLGQDTLARGNAWREMTATLAAVDIELGYEGLAVGLGTLELLFLLVGRRVSSKELESKVLVLLALLWSQRFEPFKLDEGLRAVSPTSIEHTGNDHDAVDFSRRKLFLVLDQPHGSLHGRVVLFLVELALTEQEEVYSLGALPRIG